MRTKQHSTFRSYPPLTASATSIASTHAATSLESQPDLPMGPQQGQADGQPDVLLEYPGLQLPVQYLPDSRFKHAIADVVNTEALTRREIRMLAFVNQITDKPDWHIKVFDDAIVSKWREEAKQLVKPESDTEVVHESPEGQPAGEEEVADVNDGDEAQSAQGPNDAASAAAAAADEQTRLGDVILSREMFDYCLAELQDKATRFKNTGFVPVLDTDTRCTIAKSDSAVSEALQNLITQEVSPLEDVPEEKKDWHPGSNDQVLDLVHPSLFPLVLGRTRALADRKLGLDDCILHSGSGQVTLQPPAGEAAILKREARWSADTEFNHAWGSYQWLPSDVRFDDQGKAKIASYINNLHPRHHRGLYQVLEQVIDATIPLWDEVLTKYESRVRIKVARTGNDDFEFIHGRKYPLTETPDGLTVVEKEHSDDDTDDDLAWDNDYRQFKLNNSKLIWPEPEQPYRRYEALIQADGTKPVDLRRQYGDRGLQIIFKLANIELTPDDPYYGGGSWHIEGALNEHIVATAILYYDQDNITDSHLHFRHSIDGEQLIMLPEQGEWQSACHFYGVEDQGSNEQDIGSVLTKKGRLLCFPNVLQHCVSDFELVDHSKPGHRKILAMFLVDPNIPILSTANVPPQRLDWWAEEVVKSPHLAQLPLTVFEGIVDAAAGDGLMSWEDALDIREKLMDERTTINDESIQSLVETFNFCEH